MSLILRLRGVVLALLFLLLTLFGGVSMVAAQEPVVLFDSVLGTTPDEQGFFYQALGFPVEATKTVSVTGGTVLDTTPNRANYAGYIANPVVMPSLNRAQGVNLYFTGQLLEEAHLSEHRAGFTVVLLTSDSRGIELGFWPDTIWAQNDGTAEPPEGTLFTQAEAAAFDTTMLTQYALTLHDEQYSLFSMPLTATHQAINNEGTPILSGTIRDYRAFSGPLNPYSTPNLLFLGDNTPSAQAKIRLTHVSIVSHALSTLLNFPNHPATNSPLITPTAGLTLTKARPTFDWTDAMGGTPPLIYTVTLESPNVVGLSLVNLTTTTSAYTPTSNLSNGVYQWTVAAQDSAGRVSEPVLPASFVIQTPVLNIYLPVVLK